MNIQELDILKYLYIESYVNQRCIAEETGHSIGIVNKSIKSLVSQGLLSDMYELTVKGRKFIEGCKPDSAVILAAGAGMRMVPLTYQCSKALLKVKGEVLIERIIKQLRVAGVNKIYVVAGFMKEQLEYLIDEYDVELIINPEYAAKNNLHSLSLVADKLNNTFIVPCDIYCVDNPFIGAQLYSWYMMSETISSSSDMRINRKNELVKVAGDQAQRMIGIAYLLKSDSKRLAKNLKAYDKDRLYDNAFWEEALMDNDRMYIAVRKVTDDKYIEINTYEQLREIDEESEHLNNQVINLIGEILNVDNHEIKNINMLKKGMTNRSFIFECRDKRYIMRIPGEGTDKLINRKKEAAVYQLIKEHEISDHILYINASNGYKLVEYIDHARNCDASDDDDLKACMKVLKQFHDMKLKADHDFDLFKEIERYEKLWDGEPSAYRDYEQTKKNIYELKKYIDSLDITKSLTHIDAVCDNFLIYQNSSGKKEIKLIDWEYAGNQDPHVDIAMFCIYAMYDRAQVDKLIDIYFNNKCTKKNRAKIYCYIAICGLLWSNWCEYKRMKGVEFGEYSIRQYRYAKEYFKIVRDEVGIINESR